MPGVRIVPLRVRMSTPLGAVTLLHPPLGSVAPLLPFPGVFVTSALPFVAPTMGRDAGKRVSHAFGDVFAARWRRGRMC